MGLYYVKVRVDFEYEVEADSMEQAEEQGWYWEDYCHYADVYSINVDDITPEEDEEEESE